MSIDCGSLRIGNPIRAGWGRHVLSYELPEATPGSWISATVLNGHNSSQGGLLGEGMQRRVKRWLKGPETESWLRHFIRWVRFGNKREALWLFRKWFDMRSIGKHADFRQLDENLSFGWMPSACGGEPASSGASFLMRAAESDNGELCLAGAGNIRPAVRRVTNVPLTYVSVVRDDGVAFFVGTTLAGVPTLPQAPKMRLIGVLPKGPGPALVPTLQQAALGQVGFVSATRVYGIRAGFANEFRSPLRTAACADALAGEGPLGGSSSATGQHWRPVSGNLWRTGRGVEAADPGHAAIDAGEPAGFVRLHVQLPKEGFAELHWRAAESGDSWIVRLTASGATLERAEAGQRSEIRRSATALEGEADLQVIDDGYQMRAFWNGEDLFGEWESPAGATETGAALCIQGMGVAVRGFEAHPRAIELPARMMVDAPHGPRASMLRMDEPFTGAGHLDGFPLRSDPSSRWKRTIGSGSFSVTDGGAHIEASPARPLAGRTAYTVPWPHAGDVALEVGVTPPGGERGVGANGRAGVIFWQDPDNYFIVSTWLDDAYGGASISSFFRIRGYEEIYNAVWTNVGDRISWGRAYRLRVEFDGDRYLAYVDGEPVLYRALSDVNPDWARLKVNRVGIVANWEWGTDAGSTFNHFRAWAGA